MFNQEYESLRQELRDNKKYVLERPLLIITAGLVLFDYIDGSEYIFLFPPIFMLLLLFNLAFTKNRLDSSARIVAYIRQFIEHNAPGEYRWETFLHEYRKEKVNEPGLRFYPMIYYLHIAAVILLLAIEIILFIHPPLGLMNSEFDLNLINISALVLLVIGFIWLVIAGIQARPCKMRAYFDDENNYVENTIRRLPDVK